MSQALINQLIQDGAVSVLVGCGDSAGVCDLGPYHLPGTVHGGGVADAPLLACGLGPSVTLDGVSQFIEVDHSANRLDDAGTSGTYSVVAWLKTIPKKDYYI